MSDAPPYATQHPRRWWENRWLLLAVVLAMAVPLLGPDIPPLTDLPGHLGRYRVQIDLARSPDLQRYYAFEWALIGNLGVDLLAHALAPVLGLESAVKLIVLAIPPLTVAGMLLVAREVHGRLPPTVFWALPLAYNYPLLFGFVNFALSMALALLGLGLWLRLGRQGRRNMRAALFVPFSLLLWLTHVFGWGTLGAAAFSAEVVRAWDRGARPWWRAVWAGGMSVLPLTPPFLLVLLWRSGASGGTGEWFNWQAKLLWWVSVFRDRWEVWDKVAVFALTALLVFTAFKRGLTWSRNLAASALLLFVLFVLLPRIVFGSAYADMRLAPYVLVFAVLAIRLAPGMDGRFASALAIAGLLFTAARVAGNTASALQYDADYRRELAAVPHIRRGAAVAAFVGWRCEEGWAASRLVHLPSVALARRDAMVNDQWLLPGAQLIRVTYARGAPFTQDPSQIVTDRNCAHWLRPIDDALRALPRDAFDYLWLISPPRHDARLVEGLRPLWRSGDSVLYAVPKPAIPAAS